MKILKIQTLIIMMLKKPINERIQCKKIVSKL